MEPSRFREELKKFDRQPDFLFNGAKNRWEIVGTDLKNKKYLIKAFPLGTIHTVGLDTLQELYDCSPTKQGGAAALNRRIDDLKAEEYRKEDRASQAAIRDKIDEAYIHFQYKEGTRVALNSSKNEETLVITDKRRTVHDTP
jgi:outer membrane translocation and assembly module TamA